MDDPSRGCGDPGLISAQVDVILSEDTVCGYTCCTTIELDSVTYKRVDTTAAATCCDNKCTYWDESSTRGGRVLKARGRVDDVENW